VSFGYKYLLSYQLAKIAFDLGWEFVPVYFVGFEFGRQRDQIYQDLKSSGQEALEDFEDILRFENLPRWDKNDPRLVKLRSIIEGYSPSRPSGPSFPSIPSLPNKATIAAVLKALGKEGNRRIRRGEGHVLIRAGYVLDRQIDSVEKKHETEGGYSENLLKKRLAYRSKSHSF